MSGLIWIPLTLWAAFAQTLRNAAQRHLIADVGTLGATLVRFLYGLPFSILWLAAVLLVTGDHLPSANRDMVLWVLGGSVSQIAATALLLRVMTERNFALGVAYSKTELILVALFGLAFLGDPITLITAIAITVATPGLLLISAQGSAGFQAMLRGWTTHTAMLGVASGACFAFAAVCYRGGTLSLDDVSKAGAAGYALVWAQAMQTLLLGGWLMLRNRAAVFGVIRLWRTSMLAGFMGAAASIGWFTAFSLEPVAHVRTLGLAEMLFSLAVSRRLFKEQSSPAEVAGLGLLTAGLILITLSA